ncbi:membrane-associated proteins in eicosanoid and glutathione metabolism [Panus rudis PR-1116 ss-1]|nr:membrane-associated proteins in eicosanoid and glutathione metabolism [Panus rudis PR-1116 ss-1]
MPTVVLPDGYQYAAGAVVSTLWLTVWQTIKVGAARKRAGIPYPQLYAEKAEADANKNAYLFNCTQRAHQNTLEYLPAILVSTVVTATKWPILAAAFCGSWVFARIIYTQGYSTGGPDKRNKFNAARLGGLSAMALVLSATYVTGKAIVDSL